MSRLMLNPELPPFIYGFWGCLIYVRQKAHRLFDCPKTLSKLAQNHITINHVNISTGTNIEFEH